VAEVIETLSSSPCIAKKKKTTTITQFNKYVGNKSFTENDSWMPMAHAYNFSYL
jgi:hypothetical protein